MAEGINQILRDLDARAYHIDPCDEPSLSSGCAWDLVSRSPLHAFHFHPRLGGNPKPRTKSTDHGTLAHGLMLGKGMEQIEIGIATEDVYSGRGKEKELRVRAGEPFPNWKLGAAQDAKKAIEATGRIPMLQHELDRLQPISEVMRARLLTFDERAFEGEKEVTILWVARATDGTPVQCRARLDILDLEWLIIRDLKSCRSAHPRALQRHVEAFGYHLQAAAYTQALESVVPNAQGRVQYKWLFCETSAPYPVTPVRFGGTMRRRGELLWQQAVDLWAYCMRTGEWGQGYVRSEITLEASPFGLEPFEVGDGFNEDEEERDGQDIRDQAG